MYRMRKNIVYFLFIFCKSPFNRSFELSSSNLWFINVPDEEKYCILRLSFPLLFFVNHHLVDDKISVRIKLWDLQCRRCKTPSNTVFLCKKEKKNCFTIKKKILNVINWWQAIPPLKTYFWVDHRIISDLRRVCYIQNHPVNGTVP